ncbi:MAG: hypothetical protein R3B13_33915 [Polyangiaceae bacterium]
MPRCYLLTLCSGSSLDQQSNNVTLFNLVEQINVPPGAPPPPGGAIPLEVHAYFLVSGEEVGKEFEARVALVGTTGLETYTDAFKHRPITPRYRIRTYGLPVPPILGSYDVRVDVRYEDGAGWVRDPAAWPLLVVEASESPPLVH